MSQVELKEAQSSFVLLSRGASRKQLKLKTRRPAVGACAQESKPAACEYARVGGGGQTRR